MPKEQSGWDLFGRDNLSRNQPGWMVKPSSEGQGEAGARLIGPTPNRSLPPAASSGGVPTPGAPTPSGAVNRHTHKSGDASQRMVPGEAKNPLMASAGDASQRQPPGKSTGPVTTSVGDASQGEPSNPEVPAANVEQVDEGDVSYLYDFENSVEDDAEVEADTVAR